MNLSLYSSSFDKMVNPYSGFLGLYGGGADDLVERRGGGGAPSVNLMEELLGSLIPPRSNMSLLGAGLSTSMPRGDSATECLCKDLSDVSDVDERVLLLPVMNIMKPLMVTLCCERGAPEGIKRVQAGRPRVILALLDFIFLW